jgi:hypothetical protein
MKRRGCTSTFTRIAKFAAASVVLLALAATKAHALSVTDPLSSFSRVVAYNPGDPGYTAGTNYLTDPTADQSTGQGADDFVGGFYMQSDGTNMVFRMYFNQYRSNGFGGNVRLGVDANGDGAVDVFFGVKDSGGGGSQVVFQIPTVVSATANTTPNNSALGNIITSGAGAAVATSASNYQYIASAVQYGDATYPDSEMTFSIPFQTLADTLATVTNPTTGTAFSITTSTALRYVAFTATNTNTVTQDVLGMGAIKTNGNTTFASGSFSDYYSADGARQPVPEATTVVQTMVLMGLPGYLWARRRRRRNEASQGAQPIDGVAAPANH